MEQFYDFIKNFGFPIALSAYLLMRFEKILLALANDIRNLIEKINDFAEIIKKCGGRKK